MAIKIKARWHIFCVANFSPVYLSSDNYEEKILLCFAFIYGIATQYSNKNVTFMVNEYFNFDLTRLAKIYRLKSINEMFCEWHLFVWYDYDINNIDFT